MTKMSDGDGIIFVVCVLLLSFWIVFVALLPDVRLKYAFEWC